LEFGTVRLARVVPPNYVVAFIVGYIITGFVRSYLSVCL